MLHVSSFRKQFVVAATLSFQERNYRVLPQCLCEYKNR